MWVGRQEEVSDTEKMGGKGKKITYYSNSHIIVACCFLSSARPLPSFICLACTLEAVSQKLCLLLAAPAERCEGGSEDQGLHGSWTQRVLLEPASGSQRSGQKNSWQITVFMQVRCHQLCWISELYFSGFWLEGGQRDTHSQKGWKGGSW